MFMWIKLWRNSFNFFEDVARVGKSIYSAFYNKSWLVLFSRWKNIKIIGSVYVLAVNKWVRKRFVISIIKAFQYFCHHIHFYWNFFSALVMFFPFFFTVVVFNRISLFRVADCVVKKCARVVVLSIFIDFHFLSVSHSIFSY